MAHLYESTQNWHSPVLPCLLLSVLPIVLKILVLLLTPRAEEKLDPEELMAIKLLKRELEVAVSEENYKEATRIRDHPWMRMSSDIELHK